MTSSSKAAFSFCHQEWNGDTFDFDFAAAWHPKDSRLGDFVVIKYGKYHAFKIWPCDSWKRLEGDILFLFEEDTDSHNLQWFSDVVLGLLSIGLSVSLKFSAKNRKFSSDSYTTLDWWHSIGVFYGHGRYGSIRRLLTSCRNLTLADCMSDLISICVFPFANDELHLKSEADSKISSLVELYKLLLEPRRSLFLICPASYLCYELRLLGASSELLDDRAHVDGPAIIELLGGEHRIAVDEIAYLFTNSNDHVLNLWEGAKHECRLAQLSSFDREFQLVKTQLPSNYVCKSLTTKHANNRLRAYYADLVSLACVLASITPELSSFVVLLIVEWLPYTHLLGSLKILRCIDSVRKSVAAIEEQRAQKKIKL
jgi:hypothetical protein